jgi:hypothetical protein
MCRGCSLFAGGRDRQRPDKPGLAGGCAGSTVPQESKGSGRLIGPFWTRAWTRGTHRRELSH